MCLVTVGKQKFRKDYEVVAYKTFKIRDGGLFPRRQSGDSPYVEGQWIKDEDRSTLRSECSPYATYPTGFHAHATKEECKAQWVKDCYITVTTLKVRLRHIVAVGKQSGKVYVAREMFIPKRRKRGKK